MAFVFHIFCLKDDGGVASFIEWVAKVIEQKLLGSVIGFLTQGLLLISGLFSFRSSGDVRKYFMWVLIALASLLAVIQ